MTAPVSCCAPPPPSATIATGTMPRPLESAVPARHDDRELIIRALRDRDEDAARRTMEDHITGTVTIINTEARAER